jgi:hypothetical protein
MTNEEIMSQLKSRGIEVAFLRKDGSLINSTINMNENSLALLSSIVKNSETLAKRMKDDMSQMQIGIGDSLALIYPIKDIIFFTLTKNNEDKKIIAEYAEKIRQEAK